MLASVIDAFAWTLSLRVAHSYLRIVTFHHTGCDTPDASGAILRPINECEIRETKMPGKLCSNHPDSRGNRDELVKKKKGTATGKTGQMTFSHDEKRGQQNMPTPFLED